MEDLQGGWNGSRNVQTVMMCQGTALGWQVWGMENVIPTHDFRTRCDSPPASDDWYSKSVSPPFFITGTAYKVRRWWLPWRNYP